MNKKISLLMSCRQYDNVKSTFRLNIRSVFLHKLFENIPFFSNDIPNTDFNL